MEPWSSPEPPRKRDGPFARFALRRVLRLAALLLVLLILFSVLFRVGGEKVLERMSDMNRPICNLQCDAVD